MNKTAAAITTCIVFWIIVCFIWPIAESFTTMIGAIVGFICAGIRIMYEIISGLTLEGDNGNTSTKAKRGYRR